MSFLFLLSLIVYTILASLALVRGCTELRRVFAGYLLALAVWDFATFMLRAGLSVPGPWAQLSLMAALATATLYLHFTATYLDHERLKTWIRAVYLVALAGVAAGALSTPVRAVRLSTAVTVRLDLGALWLLAPAVAFLLISGYALAQGYRVASSPDTRRARCLLILGLAGVTLGEILAWTTPWGRYPLSVAAHLGNAMLIAYAALGVRLEEVPFVLRKGLGWGLAVLIVVAGYLLVFFATLQLLLAANWGFALTVLAIALAVTLASPQLRRQVQSLVDRMLFRRRFDVQRMLQELSEVVASELDLDVLAHEVLAKASSTLNIERAYLLLEGETGQFEVAATHGSGPQQGVEEAQAASLRIAAGHVLLDCLNGCKGAVTCQELLSLLGPSAKGAEGEELIARLGAELFVPIHLKGRLVGVMAFSRREDGRSYGPEERMALTTLANQTAVAIANAQLMAAEREHRQFVETILRESAAGLMVIDPRGRIAMANPAAEALIGRAAAEMIGRPVLDILSAADPGARRRLAEVLQDVDGLAQLELTWARPDHPRDVLVSVVALRDGRRLLNLTDVTRLKELDRLKSQLVANVSHELRTPLASIKAYAELLLDEVESGDRQLQREFLEVIDHQTDHLAALISDLLDLARLESGRPALDKRPLAFREVVDEVSQMLEIQAQTRDVHMEVDIPEDLPPILADRDLMTSMVKNLIGNAIKFSHQGGKVTVRARKIGDTLQFCVCDQGIGIPPDAIPHLFEKFYRPRPTVDRAIPGTGLGLALTKEAVEAHGGTIEVESELGAGSRFTVRIPYLQEEGELQ